MKLTLWFSFLILPAVCGTASAGSINLVTNGSFEDGAFGIGSFQGWQTNLGDISTFVDSNGDTGPHYGQASDGLWAAYFGTTAADGGSSISQDVVTIPNQPYLLTFDLANDNEGLAPLNSFFVSLGNVAVFSLSNQADQDYIHYELPFVASSSSTQLAFSGSNDNSYFELDKVTVSSVPEPATSSLLLAGALALGVALRRRAGARRA